MKDKIIKQSLYNNELEISFNAGTDEKPKHLYHLIKDGEKPKRLCGVTTYLGVINKPALIPWAVKVTVEYLKEHIDGLKDEPRHLLELAKEEANKIKREAADIGSNVHEWIENYIKDNDTEMPEHDQVLNGVNNFLEWVERDKPVFHESEKIIYSKKYGYVGQADIIASIGKKKYLVDIKTCNGIWPEMLAQTAAYLKAYEEQTGEKLDGRIILKIDKDAEMPIEPIFLDEEENTVERDFQCFLHAMGIYEWEKEAKPRLKKLMQD